MSAIDECGEYHAVTPGAQPSEEINVQVVNLDGYRLRKRIEAFPQDRTDPRVQVALEQLLADLGVLMVRRAIAKARTK